MELTLKIALYSTSRLRTVSRSPNHRYRKWREDVIEIALGYGAPVNFALSLYYPVPRQKLIVR